MRWWLDRHGRAEDFVADHVHGLIVGVAVSVAGWSCASEDTSEIGAAAVVQMELVTGGQAPVATQPGGTRKDPPSAPFRSGGVLQATPPSGTAKTVGRSGSGAASSNTPALAPAAGASLAPPGVAPAAAAPGVPACTAQNVTNHGGPVVATPRVHRIFWGTWNAATANTYDTTWSTMAATPAFYTRATEYGVTGGSAGQRLNYTSGGTGALSETTIQNGVAAAFQNASITPTTSDVFMVFFPSGTSSQQDDRIDYLQHPLRRRRVVEQHGLHKRTNLARADGDLHRSRLQRLVRQ